MIAENHDDKKEVIDPELEKAQKSMKGRVDPDPTPEPDPTPAPEKKDVTPEPPAPTPPKEDPKPEPKPDGGIEDDPNKKVKRPEAFIPMKKYHEEKRENERLLAEANKKVEDALKKVEELTQIANQNDGTKKDEDIEAFMAETGFDRPTVDGFLKLAEKRLLGPERLEALKTSENIVKEAQLEADFAKEMDSIGTPALKKQFPAITEEQLEKAQELLDKVAHTNAFHDKPLDFIIYKHLEEIQKLFGDESKPNDTTPPQTKKTIEPNRPGSGKNTAMTAKDFEGQKDFSALNDLEPSVRNALIKDFPTATYENFKVWVQGQAPGLEVMRNGQKVILK